MKKYLIAGFALMLSVSAHAQEVSNPFGSGSVSQSSTPSYSAPVQQPVSTPSYNAPSQQTDVSSAQTDGSCNKVWVNDISHVYHYSTSRWYGHTARGEFMCEGDALKAGNRSSRM